MKSKLYAFRILVVLLFATTTQQAVFAQGCVAVRNMGSCSLFDSTRTGSWQFSLNYRYFRSFRHFRGKEEEKHRVEQGTEVINNDNSILVGVGYTLNNRWNLFVNIPVVYIDRSSLYEHKGNSSGERYYTSSQGLGDIRVVGYYSATPRSHFTNLILGIGAKVPTGEYNYKDYFHRPEGLQLRPVDQSIQPGDGGTGLITEFDFVQTLGTAMRWQAYASGLYLFNPRNTNGTLRNNNPGTIPLSNEMSVPDQFLFRLGGRYIFNNFMIGVGGRYEGIPVRDVFGDSDGFRRPGYIISVEPSVAYRKGMHLVAVNFPVALERNRTQSTIDIERTRQTGVYAHGDAAFADWLVSISYAYQLSRSTSLQR